MSADDFQLLGRWRNGDREAADELFGRYYVSVRRFFDVRLMYFSEDLTQRTFLGCLEGLDQRDPDKSFRAYMFGVARKQMLMQLRSKSRRDKLRGFDPPHEVPARATSITGILSRTEEHELLLRAIVDLPADLQIVLQLYYWEGMPTGDIADVVEVPPSTVTTRLARARELIKESIAHMRVPSKLGASLANNVEGWTRSLASR